MNMSSCCIICADNCDPQLFNSAAQWWQPMSSIVLPDDNVNLPATAAFCYKCNSGFEQLIILKAEMERLENELNTKIKALKRQVAESQGRFITRHLEDVRFREKLMGADFTCSKIDYQSQIYPLQQEFQEDNSTAEVSKAESNSATEMEEHFGPDEDSFNSAEEQEAVSPKRKNRRPPLKRNKTVNKNKKNSKKPPENGPSPLIKISDERFFFEGFEIAKLETGFNKCVTCGWTENTKRSKVSAIKIHISGYHLEKYNCSECKKLFKSSISLKRHQNWFHSDNPSIQMSCQICEKKFRKSDFKRHMWTHKSQEEKAALGEPFRKKIKLPSNCKFCQKSFFNRRRHEFNCVMNTDQEKGGASSDLPVSCEICGTTVKYKYSLKAHLWTHMNSVEKEEAKANGGLPPHWSKDVECTICGAIIKKMYITKHMKTHQTPEERDKHKSWINCPAPNCSKRFSCQSLITRHCAALHDDWKSSIKPFICGICNAQFSLRIPYHSHLRMHKNMKHSQEMYKVECSQCLRKCLDENCLKSHVARFHKN